MSDLESHHAGLAVFRHTNFTLYQVERFCVVAALEMQSIAVGWQVYEITRRPLDLGLVGLAQFLPNVFLFIISRARRRPLQPEESALNLQPGIRHLLRDVDRDLATRPA